MGKRNEAVALLLRGMSPGQIRRKQGVTLETILAYLTEMVGKGLITRSDILFSIDSSIRNAIFDAISENEDPMDVLERLDDWGIDRETLAEVVGVLHDRAVEADTDDIEVVLLYGGRRYALADMYEDVRAIERGLHSLIRQVLVGEYGESEQLWWRKGVPLLIRQKCVSRREEDEEPVRDPFAYTDLLDLSKIAENQWKIVGKELPTEIGADRKAFTKDIERLNHIRKLVMHPVRGVAPREEDFDFVRTLRLRLRFFSEGFLRRRRAILGSISVKPSSKPTFTENKGGESVVGD